MPTVDLFIAVRERCPLTGMHLERPVLVKFGHATWRVEDVHEYTKEAQKSAVDLIGESMVRGLGPEIRRALQNALREVQVKHLSAREAP